MKTHHRFADFLLFVLFVLLLLVIMLATPFGTKTIVSLVNTMVPIITIEGERGTLLQDLYIDKLTIKNEAVHLEFTELAIDWSPIVYKDTRLNIKQLSGNTLTIYLAEQQKKTTEKTIIPTIPIPIDLIAERVSLDKLEIIDADKELLFQSKNMEIQQAKIIDNLLTADATKATLIIKQNSMLMRLTKAQMDFTHPHAIKGDGGIHYSHIQTGTFDGKVNVAGTLTDYELEGLLDWNEQILGQSTLQIKAKGDYRGAKIEQLIIDNESAQLDMRGKIGWKEAFKWQFTINSDKVRTKKYRSDWPAEFSLALETEGSYHYADQKWFVLLDTHKLEGTLSHYPLYAAGKIMFKDSLLSVKQIDLKSGANRLKIDGRITEPFTLKWDINANKLEQLLPDVKGSIKGKGVLTGTTLKPSGQGTLLIKKLVSKGVKIGLADVKLKAGADGSLRSGKVLSHIKKVKYKDFFIESADIDFQGTEKKSLLLGRGKLRVKQFKSDKLSLQSADVTFNGDPKKLDLVGVVNKLIINGKTINKTDVTAKGSLDKHRIVLKSRSKDGNLSLQAVGSFQAPVWKGKLAKLKITNTAAGNWQLNKPVSVQISDERFSGSEICLNNPKRGFLCSHIQWNKDKGIKAKGTLERVPLAQLNPWLPEAIKSVGFIGSVNGNYAIEQKANGFYGRAAFRLPNSLLRYKTQTGIEKIPYRDGNILLTFNGRSITASAEVVFDERGVLNTNATITLASSFEQHKIMGEARFKVTHLGWINTYLPEVDKLKGDISSTIKIAGLLKQPTISAELVLKNGQIKIPDTGAFLSDIQLTIGSGRKKKARINGSLLAGQGKLVMTGWLDYSKSSAWIANVNLKGNDLQVMNTHEIQAYASPDVSIKATPKTVTILGRLHIPRAIITLDEIPETAIYESNDIVFAEQKNNQSQQKKSPLRIIPDVNISLGNNIRFNGFGLKGKLRGDFYVKDNLGSILSRGTLSVVDGQYRAYGQVLTIEQGMLIFNGPIGNPGLNIRATRRVEDFKVGLNLAGTLQEPKSSVFSDPTLPEDEALSYLLTGQKLADTEDGDTQLLLQAIRSLGINGGTNLLNRIGGSIGLDDVNIITFDDYKKNRIQLEKRLGSDLYVRYITGLFDTFHKIAIDYQISTKWSLQAESGNEQAIDFIYEVR